MRSTVVGFFLLASVQWVAGLNEELVDAGVPAEIWRQAFTPEQCKEFIDVAEKSQWDTSPDSIDYKDMYQIDLYNKGEVGNAELYALLEPHVDRITQWMKDRFPESENSMDWVFLRKYSASLDRKGLQAHVDTNEHSLNVALNTDFEGGDLFFIRQDSDVGKLGLEKALGNDHPAVIYSNVPQGVENSTTYLYPYMETGQAYAHGKALWHGITTVMSGTKFSLLFFFDEPDYIKEGREEEVESKAVFQNSGQKTYDVFWENPEGGLRPTFSLAPGQNLAERTRKGHTFVVKDRETENVVQTFRVGSEGTNIFVISEEDFLDRLDQDPADPKRNPDSQEQEDDATEDPKEQQAPASEGGDATAASAVSVAAEPSADSEQPDTSEPFVEKIEIWGYDVRPFLEDENGKPRLDVIGPIAALAFLASILVIIFVVPKLEEQQRMMEAEMEAKALREQKEQKRKRDQKGGAQRLEGKSKPVDLKKND